MKKQIVAACMLMSISTFVVAQQSPVIEKAITDKNRKANEAKADRMVVDSARKQVSDQNIKQTKSKKKTNCRKKQSCCSDDKKKSS